MNEGNDKKRGEVASHLRECPSCRREEALWRTLLDLTSEARGDVAKVMATVDWDALAERIADAAERESRRRPVRISSVRRLFAPAARPVWAGVAAGLVIGVVAMLAVFKFGLFRTAPVTGYYASQEFLDKAELELARRETISYLERSQYLLLDFAQATPDAAAGVWESQRAQDLLARKRFLDPQLEKIPMAKARHICNQIELLFLELAEIGGTLSESQWREVQSRIEESQLILKINLVKKELQGNEI